MKFVLDTNVLVRAAVRDDVAQAEAADEILLGADTVAVTSASLCEFVWVLRRVYRYRATDIAAAIERLLAAANVQVDRPTAEAGLAALKAGGDFADGVIAHEGRWLGGEIFASFDKDAVALLAEQGRATRLL